MNEQDYVDYLELINEGHSQRSAAKILGIDRCKIQRYIKKQLSIVTGKQIGRAHV